ncbi:hypothetical protein Tco_0790915 [Tanacetum coccineum]
MRLIFFAVRTFVSSSLLSLTLKKFKKKMLHVKLSRKKKAQTQGCIYLLPLADFDTVKSQQHIGPRYLLEFFLFDPSLFLSLLLWSDMTWLTQRVTRVNSIFENLGIKRKLLGITLDLDNKEYRMCESGLEIKRHELAVFSVTGLLELKLINTHQRCCVFVCSEATNEALIKNFDDIKARIEADRILAEKLQEQEREQFTIEERAKFLHDTIAAQRKFLAQQRSEAIRNRPPTKNQLRNQMMTYLKHVGNFKHSELKSKKFEDIQAMYEKIKRSDEDFIAIGSVEDDRLIKRMNKKDSSKGEEIKQESKEEVKEEDKGEENTRKRKHGTRKKMKSRKRRFKQDTSQDDPSDIEKENDELRLCLTIAPDEDKEVDYEILDKKYPIIDWKTENLGTKPQFDESKRSEEINMNVVTRSNGQKRCFSTLIRVLSVFDREDLDAVYKLVMDIYQDKIPEGFDKVLWGDLIVMFNPDEQDEFWNSQHEWKVVSWKLHSSSGVHTLMTDEGLVVHMLIEKKYPLKKEILMQMLKLKLESEEESTMALELIRFIKKSWLVQDQTVLGKDYSNLLIADSLLKTIWFINAPCYDNEALASPNTNDEELSIPEQTATGKGTSNPLMAGSLPKTTKPT